MSRLFRVEINCRTLPGILAPYQPGRRAARSVSPCCSGYAIPFPAAPVTAAGAGSKAQHPGQDDPLDLRSARVDGAGDRVPQVALDPGFLHVAVGPVDLDRVQAGLDPRLA